MSWLESFVLQHILPGKITAAFVACNWKLSDCKAHKSALHLLQRITMPKKLQQGMMHNVKLLLLAVSELLFLTFSQPRQEKLPYQQQQLNSNAYCHNVLVAAHSKRQLLAADCRGCASAHYVLPVGLALWLMWKSCSAKQHHLSIELSALLKMWKTSKSL